jgi:hypothetical protein
MPKEVVQMVLYTSDCQDPSSLRGQIFVSIWKVILTNYIREFIYMSDMATCEFSIDRYLDHISLKWSGYS